ncbi:MAG: M15 family metallopeptidase [Lachnospiraceae bacterium]
MHKSEKHIKFLIRTFTLLLIFCLFLALPAKAEGESQTETPDTPPCPTNVNAVADEDFNIRLTWDNMSPDADTEYTYEIQMAINDEWQTDIYSTGETYMNFYSRYEEVSIGNKYAFRVRTVYTYSYQEEVLVDEELSYEEDVTKTIYSDWSSSKSVKLAYSAPELLSVTSAGAVRITLKWNAVPGAGDRYAIWRSTSEDGSYEKIKTVTGSDSTISYTDTSELVTGTTYYYKVCTYNSDFKYKYGNYSEILSAVPMPSKLTPTAKSTNYNAINISWKKEDGISGYIIYQYTSKNDGYTWRKTITSADTTSYTKTGLTTGKTYYYKVKSYADVNGKKYYSTASSFIKAVPTVLAPKISSIKVAGITKATLTWEKVSGASGYAIYRATSKDGEYKRIGTVKSGKTVQYTATGMTNGKTYYFKVRAYRTVNEKNYYGTYSSIKSRLMNKLGYQGEDYYSKCRRIFGCDYYDEFPSAKAASAQMKTITVKTWDINSSGKKYTRTFKLTVHKNIASTVQQIFKEIYNGKEKFPIHSLGGYSWRGDSSSSEHCEGLAIDINPDENAMIRYSDGASLTGGFYKPGTNPYSIPSDGDVVKAFEKYGFSWGIWSTKADYMHFSYFGT